MRADTWSRGSVVLVGDTARLQRDGRLRRAVGAHVLAGEVNRHPDDLPTAPANHDRVPRPFVDAIQGEVEPRLLRLAVPRTRRAVDALRTVTAPARLLRVPDLAARFATDDRGGGRRLPEDPAPVGAA